MSTGLPESLSNRPGFPMIENGGRPFRTAQSARSLQVSQISAAGETAFGG